MQYDPGLHVACSLIFQIDAVGILAGAEIWHMWVIAIGHDKASG